MKKLIILFISSTLIMSCASSNSVTYRSDYQTQNINKFKRSKYVGAYFISNKRGDHNHPAVTKQTRKSF